MLSSASRQACRAMMTGSLRAKHNVREDAERHMTPAARIESSTTLIVLKQLTTVQRRAHRRGCGHSAHLHLLQLFTSCMRTAYHTQHASLLHAFALHAMMSLVMASTRTGANLAYNCPQDLPQHRRLYPPIIMHASESMTHVHSASHWQFAIHGVNILRRRRPVADSRVTAARLEARAQLPWAQTAGHDRCCSGSQ